jgi:hypothetical protein
MITKRKAQDLGGAAVVVLPAGLMVAAFAVAMLIASGGRPGALAILGLVYGGVVIAASGYVLILWALDGTSSKIALAILLGTVATSLFLTAGCLISGHSASTIFVWWSVLVSAIAFRAFREVSPLDAVNPAWRVDLREVASIVAVGLVVAFWCRRTAGLLPTLRSTGLAPIWSDYFIHGTEIAQFGDPLAVGHSSFLLVDQPIVFYHYASYMLPAAVARLVDLPALGLAAGLLLPYGVLMAALGILAFAKTVSSEPIALLAPMALLLLPDASSFGFRNGFFSFHWLLFTAPGSGYGLGVAFTALTVMAMWRARGRTATLCLGLIVTAALFEFRAHIFVLFAPALAMTLLWESDLARRHKRVIVSALLIMTFAGGVCVATVPVVRHAWLRFSALGPFLDIVHTGMSPTAYDGIYQMIEQHYGRAFAWVVGFSALLPIALGALTITLPVVMTVAIRRTGWLALDSFPIWCAAAWLGLVVFAPRAPHGDVTEYQHRPFVLVYAAAFVWTLLWLDRAIQATRHPRLRSWLVFVFPTLVIGALGAGIATSWHKDPAQPRFAWGSQHFGTRLDRGLLDAAAFVHTEAVVGDTFALIPTDPGNQLDDAATRFAAMADVPAYLARAGIQVLNGRERRATVEQRLAVLRQIETTTDVDAAFLRLRTIGVKFLVALGDRGPLFDADGSRAAFRTAGAAVYRIESEHVDDHQSGYRGRGSSR